MTPSRYRPALALAVLVLAPAAGGCSAAGTQEGGKPDVAVALYPLAYAVREIGGGRVAVEELTPPGAEPHDLELTPRQVGSVAGAHLVVYLHGLQPAVDEAVAQNAPRQVLDAAEAVGHHHDTARDPHFWLDPTRYAAFAEAVGEKLAEVDPAHAGAYRSRAADLVRRLERLDTAFRAGLRECARRDIVTGHAAFGYLARRYGLDQTPITGLDPEAAPSPARLAEVQRLVAARGVTTLFVEPRASAKTTTTLAADLGIDTAALDPIESISDRSRAGYFPAMRENLAHLRDALSCR
ncbi:MAG: metal ABC transporter substrate-binding protein [Streptomycetales bacterium]